MSICYRSEKIGVSGGLECAGNPLCRELWDFSLCRSFTFTINYITHYRKGKTPKSIITIYFILCKADAIQASPRLMAPALQTISH